eukprot:225509-Pelagomonas_calceolata.AAC.1
MQCLHAVALSPYAVAYLLQCLIFATHTLPPCKNAHIFTMHHVPVPLLIFAHARDSERHQRLHTISLLHFIETPASYRHRKMHNTSLAHQIQDRHRRVCVLFPVFIPQAQMGAGCAQKSRATQQESGAANNAAAQG